MNLDFLNGVFQAGENVTVRRGLKWTAVTPGETVPITDKGESTTKRAVIQEVRSTQFSRLTNYDIQREHDPACRTIPGLEKAMRDVYPDFFSTMIVVLLVFTVEEVQ